MVNNVIMTGELATDIRLKRSSEEQNGGGDPLFPFYTDFNIKWAYDAKRSCTLPCRARGQNAQHLKDYWRKGDKIGIIGYMLTEERKRGRGTTSRTYCNVTEIILHSSAVYNISGKKPTKSRR